MLGGLSKKQPFCNGKHKTFAFEKDDDVVMPFKSLRIEASEEEREVWLCRCKHTKNAPFCNETHNSLKG